MPPVQVRIDDVPAAGSSESQTEPPKTVRNVNSQVFDDTPETPMKPPKKRRLGSNTSQATERRRSSWAFWNSEPKTPGRTDDADDKSIASSVTDKILRVAERERGSWSAFWGSAAKGGQLHYDFQPNTVVSSTSEPFIASEPVSQPGSAQASPKKRKIKKRQNMIVPSFEETIPEASPYTTVSHGFKRAKAWLGYEEPGEDHLYRKQRSTQFKRVLLIGVHGFFPNKMLRPLLGEPTGTSVKFCQVADKAVRSWAKENDTVVEIQKIALEKEGKIFDRVDYFYDLLKKHADAIKEADFIFVCAHSQGTPVAIILMSKLLEHGIIDSGKRIGLLGMAGINNGPFYGVDQSLLLRAYSTFENDSLMELFQFQNFESLQSRKYLESLRNLVRHNAKITFVGSIDDQLVPLYSSIASHVSHPNLFKAVYIDGSTETPDFVGRIIKMSTTLQNQGFSDHDVLKEISPALAGPLTGGGHSTIYNDQNVYKLALDFTLKTEDSVLATEKPVRFLPFDLKKVGKNPYNLPWCVRGLFFEVLRRLDGARTDVDMVFKEFDEWNPESKALKDVKYRLNGIKAKL